MRVFNALSKEISYPNPDPKHVGSRLTEARYGIADLCRACSKKNPLRDHVQSRDLIGYLGSRIRTKTRILSTISSTQLTVSRASSQPTFN
jgi:hypothetical protein